MVRHHFTNIFECNVKCKGQPLKGFGATLDKPRCNAAGTAIKPSKGTFTAPIGLAVSDVDYKGATSTYRQMELAELDGRIVEYYQYVMQPVSVFIFVPNSVTMPIDILTPKLRVLLPSIVNEMTKTRMQVTLPSRIYKKLQRAKISAHYREKLARHADVGQDDEVAAVGDVKELKANGPFVIVVYDQEKREAICNTIIYNAKPASLRKMSEAIRKLKRRDEQLIGKLLKSSSNEQVAEECQQAKAIALEACEKPADNEAQDAAVDEVADALDDVTCGDGGDDDDDTSDDEEASDAEVADVIAAEVHASKETESRHGTFSTYSRKRALSVLINTFRDFGSRDEVASARRPRKITIPPVFQVEDEALRRQKLYTMNKSRLVADMHQSGSIYSR